MPTLNRRKDNTLPNRKQGRNNRQIYKSYRWQQFSKLFLKANPLCVECLKEGKTVRSRASDHKIPIEEGGEIWNVNNLNPLCISHHNRKSRLEKNKHNKPNSYEKD